MKHKYPVVGVKKAPRKSLAPFWGGVLAVMVLALVGAGPGSFNQAIVQAFGGPLNLRNAVAGEVPVKQADGTWAPGAGGGGGGGTVNTSGSGLSGDGSVGDPLTLSQVLEDLITAEGAGGEGVSDIAAISTAAKGSIIVHNGQKWTLLPAGSNGQVATIDTSTENYVSWVTPAGGAVDPGDGSGGASYLPTTVIGSSTDSNPYTVDAQESSTVFTNVGATELCEAELPDCQLGLHYYFYVADADGFKITAVGGNKIVIAGSATAAGGSVQSTTIGNALHLVATQDSSGAGNHWVAVSAIWGTLGTQNVSVTLGSTTVNLTASDSGNLYADDGTNNTNSLTVNLPLASAGLHYQVYARQVDANDLTEIVAQSGDTIKVDTSTVSASGGKVRLTSAGSSIWLVALNDTEWVARSVTGSWTVDP